MSVCGQSGQTEEDSGSEEVTASAAAVRQIYKQKSASKVVRVLTVLAYLLSVSLAAILLSVYYVCVWKSPELPRLNDTGGSYSAQRADPHRTPDYIPSTLGHIQNFTGGGDSGVSTLADTANATSMFDSSVEETSTDSALNDSTTTDTTLPDTLYDTTTNDSHVT